MRRPLAIAFLFALAIPAVAGAQEQWEKETYELRAHQRLWELEIAWNPTVKRGARVPMKVRLWPKGAPDEARTVFDGKARIDPHGGPQVFHDYGRLQVATCEGAPGIGNCSCEVRLLNEGGMNVLGCWTNARPNPQMLGKAAGDYELVQQLSVWLKDENASEASRRSAELITAASDAVELALSKGNYRGAHEIVDLVMDVTWPLGAGVAMCIAKCDTERDRQRLTFLSAEIPQEALEKLAIRMTRIGFAPEAAMWAAEMRRLELDPKRVARIEAAVAEMTQSSLTTSTSGSSK